MHQNKLDAIYDLRDAAEKKGRAEQELETRPSAEARDELLSAQLEVEKKTVAAINVCHQCGHEHTADEPHAGNVLRVDFPRDQSD